MNFIELCLAGDVLEDEIDDFVDNWHDGKAGEGQELYEFLGMSWEEYSIWATKPSILSFILSAHKKHTHLDIELNQEQLPLAARAETAAEAQKMETWLKTIGKA